MSLSSILTVTRKQLKIISFFIYSPLSLSPGPTPTFSPSQPQSRRGRGILKFKLITLKIYAAFLLFNGVWNFRLSTVSRGDKALVLMFSPCIPVLVLTVVSSLYENPANFATLLNMMLAYERQILVRKWKKIQVCEKFLKVAVCLLGFCGTALVPTFVMLLILARMDRIPFLGSIIPGIVGNY